MKKIYLLTLILSIFSSANSLMADIHNISTRKSGILPNQYIGTRLNYIIEKLNTTYDNNTTIIIKFDIPGKYYFNTSLNVKCNIKIDAVPGVTLEIPEDFKFIDDCIFGFIGGKTNGKINKISVAVSNLTIKLAEHSGILWNNTEKHLFKLYHANKVYFNNVKTFLNNAKCTNLDMRICSNIEISDCEFENYNNCRTGGSLWMRGDTENVKIYNNKFRKYGNDEIIAIWGNNTLTLIDINSDCTIVKRNIDIYNNDIYYGYHGKDKTHQPIDKLLYIYTTQVQTDNCRNVHYIVDNINIRNNKFIIDDPVRYNISLLFDKFTDASNIKIENNSIIYNELCKDLNGYTVDFDIINENNNNEWISIYNNKISGSDYMKNNSGNIPHLCLSISDAKVLFNNNIIESTNGVTLFSINAPKADIILNNNICKGLRSMGSVSSNDIITNANISATDNIFNGDTRIFFRADNSPVMNADLVFRNNKFNSNDNVFFLQNFAKQGTLIFENNYVKLTNGNAACIYSYYESYTDSNLFKELIIRNNVFYNINPATLFDYIKKYNKKIISDNIYP